MLIFSYRIKLIKLLQCSVKKVDCIQLQVKGHGIIRDPEEFSVRMCQSVCVCNWWHGFLWQRDGVRSLTSITCDRISDGSKVSSSSNVHNCHCPAVSWLFKLWSLHIHNQPCVGLIYWGKYWAGSHESPCSHVISL